MERIISLNDKEQRYAAVITNLLKGVYTNKEAAKRLNLSIRQVIRLKKGVQQHGLGALSHGNRNRKPAHALTDDLKQKVVELASSEYKDASYTHLSELLERKENIKLSVTSIKRILVPAGIKSPRKRRPNKKHRSRERHLSFGSLVQIDGSPHHWLGEGTQPFTLHAAIDDATSAIVGAYFTQNECAEGYMTMLRQMCENYGAPISLYTDKHTIFRSPKTDKLTIEEELAGITVNLTQLGRAIDELGIIRISAHSPQAKGRIERLFGTLQPRWAIELRLLGAQTIAEANAHLPYLISLYNERFAIKPQAEESEFLPLPPNTDLDNIFCYKNTRKLKGGVLSFEGKKYKILSNSVTAPVTGPIIVHKHLNGVLKASSNSQLYDLQLVTHVSTTKPVKKKEAGPRVPHKPAPNHPWRQYPQKHRPIIAHAED